jgi:hypothetical protein
MRVSEIHSLIYLRSLNFWLLNVLESGREGTILRDNRHRNKTIILREGSIVVQIQELCDLWFRDTFVNVGNDFRYNQSILVAHD